MQSDFFQSLKLICLQIHFLPIISLLPDQRSNYSETETHYTGRFFCIQSDYTRQVFISHLCEIITKKKKSGQKLLDCDIELV